MPNPAMIRDKAATGQVAAPNGSTAGAAQPNIGERGGGFPLIQHFQDFGGAEGRHSAIASRDRPPHPLDGISNKFS
jgi:hypothetical protein